MRVERWEAAALGGILLVALAARVVGLDAGLWYDEIYTLTHYVREPLGQLLGDFSSLNNHMFYSLQAKASVALFGESAWALRLPALVFGLGSLIIVWLLGRDVAGRPATLVAVLLLAISYHHVWFSQNARGYTGLLFWTSLATLCFVRGMARPGPGVWVGYGVAVAAAMYTHLSAGFFFAAHGVVGAALLLRDRRGLRPLVGVAVGVGLTLLLHLPLFSQVFAAMNKVSDSKTASPMAEWVNPLRTLAEIAYSLSSFGALSPVLIGGALVVVAVGAVTLVRRAPVLAAIYLLSIPLGLGILLALSFRIWPRYFFVDIGFVLLCVAIGVEVLARWFAQAIGRPGLGDALVGAGVVALVAASLVLLPRNYSQPKQDFAGAIAFVADHRAPGDVATSIGLASEPLSSYLAPNWPVVTTAADLAGIEARARQVWIVTAFDDHVEADEQPILAAILRNYTLAGEFDGTLGGGTVKVYRSRAATGRIGG